MTVTNFPTQVAEITTDWLNSVLGARFGEIASFRLEPFAEGVGILGEIARLHLDYTDERPADPGAGSPPSIIAKCQAPAPENRFLAEVMGFYDREVNFYRHVADEVDIPVPRPYHVDAGPNGLPFVILMEDVVGAWCPDQLAGLSADDADRIISAITPLHVQYWGSPSLDGLGWLPPMNNDMYKGGHAMAEARLPEFIEHFGDRVSDSTMAMTAEVCARYVDMLDHSVGLGTTTFTHTDCRAENYLFGGPRGDGAVTVVDFQLSTRHVGMWDVTNLLAGSLDPVLRREHERDLIGAYVGRIRAAGIDYTIDQAMDQYRMCLLHQVAAQVITSDLSGGNERGAELLEQLHLRPVIAAEENDAASMLTTF